MAQVFISYASADRERAKRIADAMETKGYSVWWDRQIAPGQRFDEVIEEALNTARCVVVLWSTASVKSDWVKTEAAEASSRKVLIPALIDNVKIPLEFRRLQAADLSHWDGRVDDLEFEKFLRAVDMELQENEAPQPLSPKASRQMGSSSGTAAATAPAPDPIPVHDATAKPTAARSQPAPSAREPQAAPQPRPAEPRRARWALVALPVVAIVIAVILFNGKAEILTPNVVGMSYESATTELAKAGLAPERQERPSANDAPGTVVAQIPAAGTTPGQATKVTLTVAVAVAVPVPAAPAEASLSVGEPLPVAPPVPSTIPDLKGQTPERANELLSAAALSLGVRKDVASNDMNLGTVISQDPEATQTLPKNSPVNITVVARRKVPELVGLDLQKAQAELTRLGLTHRVESAPAGRGESDNRVVKQSPAPGLEIENGGETQLTIAVVTPKQVFGGEGLYKTEGRRCVQVCKDKGLLFTTKWSGNTNMCTCELRRP